MCVYCVCLHGAWCLAPVCVHILQRVCVCVPVSCTQAALQEYRDEVTSGAFPSVSFSPYKIPDAELMSLVQELRDQGAHEAAAAAEAQAHQDAAGRAQASAAAASAAPTPVRAASKA